MEERVKFANDLTRAMRGCCGEWEWEDLPRTVWGTFFSTTTAHVRMVNTGQVHHVVRNSNERKFSTYRPGTNEESWLQNYINCYRRDDAGNTMPECVA